MQRRHHYECAFEEYLRGRRIPYVAVDEARKALLPMGLDARGAGAKAEDDPALKSFDFVVYGEGVNLLVDVKGRKLGGRSGGGGGKGRKVTVSDFAVGRLESWVTEEDVRSLQRWQRLFDGGSGTGAFAGTFVFIYWCQAQPPDALFQEVFEHRGEWYALRVVGVDEYARSMKPRSAKWRTVDLPRRVFEQISRPFAPSLLESGDRCREGWAIAASDEHRAWGSDAGPEEPALLPLAAPLGSW